MYEIFLRKKIDFRFRDFIENVAKVFIFPSPFNPQGGEGGGLIFIIELFLLYHLFWKTNQLIAHWKKLKRIGRIKKFNLVRKYTSLKLGNVQTFFQGMVEFVASGSRFRVFIPRETCVLTFLLGGISCVRSTRTMPSGDVQKGEPYGDECLLHVKAI